MVTVSLFRRHCRPYHHHDACYDDLYPDSVQFGKQPSSDREYCCEVRTIEGACFEQLQQLSTSTGATLSTLFHCLWGIFLAKTNETNDVVFGSVQSIRPLAHAQFDRLIGLCINTMPYRIHFSDQDSFAGIAQKSQLAQLNCS
ncbi:condensation domain-containing protein [Vibrio sp. PP-XX7]